ncbi:hypothetical protein ACFLTX_02825 [Chloroflexota bacterium]
MSDELRPTEGRTESAETRTPEQQELNDATFEPGAFIEQSGDFKESEEIQEALVDISENAVAESSDLGAAPIPLPQPIDTIESTEGGGLDVSRDTTATPLPIPMPLSGESEIDPDPIIRPKETQQVETISQENNQQIESLRSISQELQDSASSADEGDLQEIQEAAETLDQLAVKLEELQSTPQPDQGQVDEVSTQAELASLKLQNIVDRGSRSITEMSGVMKKAQDTASSIINNIK